MPAAAKGFRGKPRTNPPQVLKYDLNKYYTISMVAKEHNYCHCLKLNSKRGLEEIRNLALNQDERRHLSIETMGVGEAASSIDEMAYLQ